jgi:FkbM family methyltransferase
MHTFQHIFRSLWATIKPYLKKLPFAFTKNQRYDRQTAAIIRRTCTVRSNCIDAGTHKGEILDLFIKSAPLGHHFGFEPLPQLYAALCKKYNRKNNIHLFDAALSHRCGTSSFNYVRSNPSYSGLKKRSYDRPFEEDEQIEVRTVTLDSVMMPLDIPVHLVKIDVEGGELDVLKGARGVLSTYHPLVIFECGIGGSDHYGTTPHMLYHFFEELGYRILLMDVFLKGGAPLSYDQFKEQFNRNLHYYFIAAYDCS